MSFSLAILPPYPQGCGPDLISTRPTTSETVRYHCDLHVHLSECISDVEILFVLCGYFLLEIPALVLDYLQML